MSAPLPVPSHSRRSARPVPDENALFGADEAGARGPEDAPVRRRKGPTSEELLEGLNEPQRQAVTHAGSPLLVVAGAGSGKTRVLTRRVAWLIAERNAHPGSILAITFTNKAAAEMRERVESLVGPRAKIMWVSTFHSACVRILRKEVERFGIKSRLSIYDAADQKRLMTLICREDSTSTSSATRPGRSSTGSRRRRTS